VQTAAVRSHGDRCAEPSTLSTVGRVRPVIRQTRQRRTGPRRVAVSPGTSHLTSSAQRRPPALRPAHPPTGAAGPSHRLLVRIRGRHVRRSPPILLPARASSRYMTPAASASGQAMPVGSDRAPCRSGRCGPTIGSGRTSAHHPSGSDPPILTHRQVKVKPQLGRCRHVRSRAIEPYAAG
jgi:hypothetical protein